MVPLLRRLLFGSLRRQLALGTALVVAATVSLFAWDLTVRQQTVALEQQSDQAVALARSVATSSAVWVASRDFSGLQEIIEGLSRYPDLRHAIVLDPRGQVLAHSDRARLGLYLTDLPEEAELKFLQRSASLVDVACPVMLADHQIGWVRIGLARDSLDAKLAEMARGGIFYALVAIVLSTLFAVLASRYLTRRLYAIQRVADAVRAGQSGLRAVVPGDDEAAQLARQFNGMLDTLDLREEALKESEGRFRSMADSAPVLIWTAGVDKRCDYFNKVWLEFTGRDIERELGNGWLEGVHPEDMQRCLDTYTTAFDARREFVMEYRLRRFDGEYRWLVDNGVPRHDPHGTFMGYIGSCSDITERKRAEERLQLAASVFTHAREGIMITAADGTIIDVNDAFTRITSYDRDEILGRNPRMLSSGRQDESFYAAMWRDLVEKGHWYGEVWNRRKNGEVYATMQTIGTVRDAQGKAQQFVALFSDITPLKEHERQLEHIAHYDALTNLPNRVLLADRLCQAMAQTQRRGQQLALVYLDLDGFKAVNDSHGHDVGDQLLMVLATRMKQALREGDTLARLGGDEFVGILVDLPDAEASVPMLTRLLAAAAQPVQVGDLLPQVSASIGVTFYPQANDVDADQLLRQADQAMYRAKLAGKNRYHVFDAEQDRNVQAIAKDWTEPAAP